MKINFLADKTSFFQADSGENTKDFGILDHIEKIVEISQRYGIDKCLNKGKEHFGYINRKLGLSPLQTVLFAHFMEKSSDNHIHISEIAESIKCSNVRIIKYINECDELEKKKLIRCSRDGNSILYRVPREVQESLRKYGEYKPETNENISIDKLFTVLEQLFKEREDNELSFEALKTELLDLIRINTHLHFCQKILSYTLEPNDLVLFLCFCHLAGNNNDDNIGDHDFGFLYEDKCRISAVKRSLANGYHNLIKDNYIEYANSGGFVNNEAYKVSEASKKELLSELTGLGKKDFKKNILLSQAIKIKKMFYNQRESEAIQTLTELLKEEHYRKIQERLTCKGMRKGFACLFSGAPGTGKTETAYQIARETERNIMMVDLSETKSCWYGETEKKIKEIFDDYRAAVDHSDAAPILLFNEADGVIGKRKAITGENHSIDQTENTVQNIILQEMENLTGILIATTNLTQNMDPAFERRFLYKIAFEKPGQESRRGIWKALLPDVPQDILTELASGFELSGGQIENIARKTEVDAILSGKSLSIDTLLGYCKDEMRNNLNAFNPIGFARQRV
ncbi:MAG: ATP-binding protein [Spirochaetaceae bacterium]|nr:ATP-binding protein [Spirochaetaceae bacterium]